jgi:hypothetical protein
VFYGVSSHMISAYGLESKAHAIDAYRAFMRDEGVPSVLHRDRAAESCVVSSWVKSDVNVQLGVRVMRKQLVGSDFQPF